MSEDDFEAQINNDCVVRTVYYKYPHPKEVHIKSGILNREILNQAKHMAKGGKPKESSDEKDGG